MQIDDMNSKVPFTLPCYSKYFATDSSRSSFQELDINGHSLANVLPFPICMCFYDFIVILILREST